MKVQAAIQGDAVRVSGSARRIAGGDRAGQEADHRFSAAVRQLPRPSGTPGRIESGAARLPSCVWGWVEPGLTRRAMFRAGNRRLASFPMRSGESRLASLPREAAGIATCVAPTRSSARFRTQFGWGSAVVSRAGGAVPRMPSALRSRISDTRTHCRSGASRDAGGPSPLPPVRLKPSAPCRYALRHHRPRPGSTGEQIMEQPQSPRWPRTMRSRRSSKGSPVEVLRKALDLQGEAREMQLLRRFRGPPLRRSAARRRHRRHLG